MPSQSRPFMSSFTTRQQSPAAVRGPASHATPRPTRWRTAASSTTAQSTVAGLTQEQVDRFHHDGFLALPGFASKEQIRAMMQRCNELVESWDPQLESRRFSVFSTKEQQSHAKDAYFLDSASEINFFFEEKAVNAAGELQVLKERALNKIGHAVHDLDPVFRSFTRSPAIAAILQSLGYQRPLPVQSMYIFKQPSIGGEVVPHQDSTFLHTSPMSCIGLWLALEDANKDNGCLWAIKGIHKQGLSRRFKRLPEGGVGFDGPAATYDLTQAVPIECEAGTLVLLHGENVHYSAENTSPASRHSWALHFIEGAPGYEWGSDNWAHRKAGLAWEPLYDHTAAAQQQNGGSG
eukprot:GHUV01003082.1.p1 GENE.GHUV01003082.1~~GHUV01003082.1.p1  ORF type:complete len:349 (+),score=56.95 GHUV01003082.1:509-1555(+)